MVPKARLRFRDWAMKETAAELSHAKANAIATPMWEAAVASGDKDLQEKILLEAHNLKVRELFASGSHWSQKYHVKYPSSFVTAPDVEDFMQAVAQETSQTSTPTQQNDKSDDTPEHVSLADSLAALVAELRTIETRRQEIGSEQNKLSAEVNALQAERENLDVRAQKLAKSQEDVHAGRDIIVADEKRIKERLQKLTADL